MFRRTATEEMIKDVLGESYVNLSVQSYEMNESIGDGRCEVNAMLKRDGNEEKIVCAGVGFVDALYHGLVDHYAREYASLSTITFTKFDVKGHMSTSETQGSDAECVVTLVVRNTEEREFRFEDSSRSLVAATLKVVVEAAEYFINSERAYITAFKAMVDARARNRQDLLETYTAQLAELVKTTSYSDVIERLKNEQSASE